MKKYILALIFLVGLTKGFSQQNGVMDNFDDNILDPNWKFNISCASCYSGTEANGELQVTPTAAGVTYENFEFQFTTIDMTPNPVVKISVKNSTAFNFRIDLEDELGFRTNASPTVKAIPINASYVQYIFDFTGKFNQGAPDPAGVVDPAKIHKVVFFFNPGGPAYSNPVFLNDLIVGTPSTPVASFSASASTVCTSVPVTFTNTSSGTVSTYAWNFGAGATPATSSSATPPAVSWSSTGSKTVSLMVTGPGGSNTTTSSITVNGVPAAAGAITGPTVVCNGGAGNNYSVPASLGATSYVWSLPTGASITAGDLTKDVTVTFGSTGGTVRVTPTNACGSATSAGLVATMGAPVVASVTISTPSTSICNGAVTFTAAPTNGGSAPLYQWKVNNVNVGTNSAAYTYTTSSLLNNDVVKVVMTSNASCVTSSPATSNSITMTVTASGTPTISIATTTPTICQGDVLIFSSVVTNGGGSPTYAWKKNGVVLTGETNDSLMIVNFLNDQDVFSATVTASSGCASGTSASNFVTITVNPAQMANVFATSPLGDTACIGGPVVFTAIPTIGGSAPVYQWKVNGANVGTNSPTYNAPAGSIVTGDQVSVVMTSNSTQSCVRNNPATSAPLDMVMVSTLTSAVQITSTATTICSGQPITFTATPKRNAGASPTYAWKLNGTTTIGTGATLTTSALANNDKITCIMTSSISCAQPSTSNQITITVTTTVAPSVTITADPSNSICTGSTATFTATPVNGGANPGYEWFINGTSQGAVLQTFTPAPASLSNNAAITVQMTSDLSCASTPLATSPPINIIIKPTVTPSISITSTATTVCPGIPVKFTAAPVNGGPSPSLIWKNNGIPTGETDTTYTVSNLFNGDQITCEMTPNHPCGSTSMVPSNPIVITVSPSVTAAVNITSNPTTICPATAVVFTAAPTGGGSTPAYQWKLNGNNAGTNNATYNVPGGLAVTDVVTCVMTSNAACVTNSPVTSNTKTVSPSVTAAITINASVTSICSGTPVTLTSSVSGGGAAPTYQWTKNNIAITPAETGPTYSTSTLANNDVVKCIMTSNAACAVGSPVTSSGITFTVTPSPTMAVAIGINPPGSSSICGGTSITFTPTTSTPSPSYQWQVNNQTVGTGSTYTSSTLANSDAVSVIMTSSASCAAASATSNTITMSVSNPPSAADAGFDQSVTSSTASLTAATPASGGGVWTTSGSATITPPATNASVSVSNLSMGANTFTWTVTSGSCPPSSDNVIITRGTAPVAKTISGLASVLANTTSTYSITSSAGSSYTWTVVGATFTGQGTNSISVTFGTGAVDLYVTEFNNFGDITNTKHVVVGTPPSQKTISGPDYAVQNSTGINYSIPADAGSTYSWTVTGATPTSGTSNNINIDFGTTTTVTLSVTETNDFGFMTANKTVNVGTIPAVPIITGPDTVVTGATVSYTIAAHTGSTYLWNSVPGITIASPNSNTTNITFNTSGSVTLSVTETNASGPNTGIKQNIKVGTVATVTSISGQTTVQSGTQYTYQAITSSGAHSIFYWTFPAGTTIISNGGSSAGPSSSITVSFPANMVPGTITVRQDNGFGESFQSIPVTMTATGIGDPYNSLSYTLFPNPFSDEVNLSFNTPVSSSLFLRIINMTGNVIYSSNEFRTNEKIVLGKELTTGLYIIQAVSNEKAQTIKINKE